MLAGIFIPVAKVHAVENCIDNREIQTEAECRSLGYTWIAGNTTNNVNRGFSCDLDPNPKFQDLLLYLVCIINNSVIPIIFALAVVMFVWGVVQYVINSDEEAKKEKGKQFMIWGIIALAVMVSVWGLVSILGNTFGIEYAIPQVKSVTP